MPHYLFQARYSTDALKAMVNNPQDREAAARPLIEALGGKLHSLYFCFGAEDVIALIEAPNDEAMAACALAVGASGAFLEWWRQRKLMTSKEAMGAMAKAKIGLGKLYARYRLECLAPRRGGPREPPAADAPQSTSFVPELRPILADPERDSGDSEMHRIHVQLAAGLRRLISHSG